ncbi:MAG: DsrE family protein [Telluria sp.]
MMDKPHGARRVLVTQALAVAAAALCTGSAQAAAPGGAYKAVFQVSDPEPQKWNLTLNNAKNALAELGSDTQIEVVAFGPGIGMLKAGSEVAARVAEAASAGVRLVACQNTMRAMHLEPKDMNPAIGYVPSGAAELIRKQTEGWAYLRS